MNHNSILPQILSKDQKILHLTLDTQKLEDSDTFEEYKIGGPSTEHDLVLDFNDKDFALNIPKGHYDTIVLTTILEQIEDPVNLITRLKYLSEYLIIWEFKYDALDNIDPTWRQPWKEIGLTWNLQQHFDLINELFLQEATLLTCKLPYTPKEEKENVNAIR